MLAGRTSICCTRWLSASTCGCARRYGHDVAVRPRGTPVVNAVRAAYGGHVSSRNSKKWNRPKAPGRTASASGTSPLIDRLPVAQQDASRTELAVTYEDVMKEANATGEKQPRRMVRESSDATTSESNGPPLRPFELAELVKQLVDADKLSEAINLVKGSPQSSQNTVVWNLLILSAFSLKQPRTAYDLFTDMKRRGLKPAPSTWTILFQGFSRMTRDKPLSERSIERISSAYLGFMSYLASARASDPITLKDCLIPFNAYLGLLSELDRHKELFDVFNSLFDDDMLRPDQWTYTIVLQSVLKRKEDFGPGEQEGAIENRNAALGRRVWDGMMKRLEKGSVRFEIDSHLVCAMLRVLTASTRMNDWQFGVTLIDELLGLRKPDALSPPRTNHPMVAFGVPKAPPALSGYSLYLALLLVTRMRRFRFALHYVQQIMDSPYKELLAREHMHIVINSYAELAIERGSTHAEQAFETVEWMVRLRDVEAELGRKLAPTQETFTLLLRACWKAGQYNLTRRTFALMSGYSSDDFDRPGLPSSPNLGGRRGFLPDAHGLACIVRCAMATKNVRNMDHALRILRFIGTPSVFGLQRPTVDSARLLINGLNSASLIRMPRHKETRDLLFYRMKLAEAILEHENRGGTFPFELVYERQLLAEAQTAREAFHPEWIADSHLTEWMGEFLRTEHPSISDEEEDGDQRAEEDG